MRVARDGKGRIGSRGGILVARRLGRDYYIEMEICMV